MYKEKNILCVVPARGGSKGIPLKNLREISGVSLVARAGHIAAKISLLDKYIVSTDHVKIAEVAKKSGLEVPFMRPESLSGDRISDYQVLSHALVHMERSDNKIYDIVVMLQPTSPSRTVEQVEATIKKLADNNYDSVITVNPIDLKNHPLKLLSFDEDKLRYYDERGKTIIARQQLTPLYQRNGVAYAMTRSCLLDQKSVIGENASAIVISDDVVNIDTEEDLLLAQALV
jgi:CMP-N,N'-diacetyllegionaminic acid synthase